MEEEDEEALLDFYMYKWQFVRADENQQLNQSQEEIVQLFAKKTHTFQVNKKPVLPEISEKTQSNQDY